MFIVCIPEVTLTITFLKAKIKVFLTFFSSPCIKLLLKLHFFRISEDFVVKQDILCWLSIETWFALPKQ